MSYNKESSSLKEKAPRLSSYSVCQYIMSIIFNEGLISLDALQKAIPETSKETLISILEVLHVLGLIQCFTCTSSQASTMKSTMSSKAAVTNVKVDRPNKKMKTSKKDGSGTAVVNNSGFGGGVTEQSSTVGGGAKATESATLFSSPVLSLSQKHTVETYYSATDHARGTNFTQYVDLVEQIRHKRENKKKLLERIAKLDALSKNTNYSEAQRLIQLRKLMNRYVIEDTNLQHDKLYLKFL